MMNFKSFIVVVPFAIIFMRFTTLVVLNFMLKYFNCFKVMRKLSYYNYLENQKLTDLSS